VTVPLRWLILGEGSLVILALVWGWLRGITFPFRIDLTALGVALVATAGFLAVNFSLYRFGKRTGHPVAVHAFLEAEVFPLFHRVPIGGLVLLSVLAGLGEELLFRGVLQKELGIWIASAAFGLLHGPSRELWPLALWATGMGIALGVLYQASGNLFVPAFTHALYDGAALIYVSRRQETGSANALS
jgi:membrane protease YdiL (CAAX protease family)